MTVSQLIEKLEHLCDHRLETEVKFWFWFDGGLEEGKASIEHVGDCIEIAVELEED